MEREQLLAIKWTTAAVPLLFLGFAACMFTFYSLVAVLLQRASATFFNLSILTADFFTLVAGLLIFKYDVSNGLAEGGIGGPNMFSDPPSVDN